MFSRHSRMLGVIYALADVALAFAAFWIAHAVRGRLHELRPLYPVYFYLWIVPFAVVLWLGTGWAAGVYRGVQDRALRRALLDPLTVNLIAPVLLFALISIFKVEFISRALLGLYAVCDFLLMAAFRVCACRARLQASIAGLRHFLVVGWTREALEMAGNIERSGTNGLMLAGFAVDRSQAGETLAQPGLRREYPVYDVRELPALLRQHVIDEIVFAVSQQDLARLEETFLLCEREGVRTRLSLGLFPHAISRISLDRLYGAPLLTFSPTPEDEYLMLLKRMADFVMALILLIALSPLFLILAALIKLTSRGPVFYRQTRCGLGGRKFTLYKFRSMRAGSDLRREELAALNESDGPVFKIKNDPRRTMAGRLMRRLSLDELPQLFNILKGDMSFVGPRPPLPEEVEQYEAWQRRRLRMSPGLTCLWALEGRSHLSFNRWMELDLEYIDHWSPWLDWKILLKTIPVVLLGRGAF